MEDVIVNEVTDWIKLNCPFLKLSLSEFYILIRYITLLLSYSARSECHNYTENMKYLGSFSDG